MEAKVTAVSAVNAVSSVTDSTGSNDVKDRSKEGTGLYDSHSNRAGIKKKPKRSIEAAERLRMISNSEKDDINFSNTSSLSSSVTSEVKDPKIQLSVRTTRMEEVAATKKRASDDFLEDNVATSSDNDLSGDDCGDEDDIDGDVSDSQYDGDRLITNIDDGADRADKDGTYKKSSSNKKSKKTHVDSSLRAMATVAGQLARNPSYSTEEAKDAAKREYNRLNAARARVRQKDRLQTLEKDYAKLSELTTRLQRENDILKSQLDVLLQTTNKKNQSQAVVSNSMPSGQIPLVVPSTLSQLSTAVAGAVGALTPSDRSSATSSTLSKKHAEKPSMLVEQPPVTVVDSSVLPSSKLNLVTTTTPNTASSSAVVNGSVIEGQSNPNGTLFPSAAVATPSIPSVPNAVNADTNNSAFINSILSTATSLLIQHQQQQQQQQQQKLQLDLQQQQLQQQLLQTPLSALQNAAVLEQFLRLSNIQPSQLQQSAPLASTATGLTTSPFSPAFAAPASNSASTTSSNQLSNLMSTPNQQAQSQILSNNTRQLMASLPSSMTPNNLNLMSLMLQQQQQQQQLGLLNQNGSAPANTSYEQSSSSSSSNQVTGFPFFTTG
jgi:hypothetical protein